MKFGVGRTKQKKLGSRNKKWNLIKMKKDLLKVIMPALNYNSYNVEICFE